MSSRSPTHIGRKFAAGPADGPPDETIKAIYRAWFDHLVIVFPGPERLEQEDLVPRHRLLRRDGMPRRPPRFFPKGYSRLLPGIMLISNIRENGEPIEPFRTAR